MAPFMKHDLERKYKRWRRGMSKNAGVNSSGAGTAGKGSLKQQLRGKERLLERLQAQKQPQEGQAENSTDQLDKLRLEIQELKQEMERKQAVEKERQHAVKSHGTRFLERQRLTRMEKAIKGGRGDHDQKEKERMLQKIALDMVYVAYYPHDVKYYPLFRKGIRVVDDRRTLVKRAKSRQRVLKNLQNLDDNRKQKVNWITPEQYRRLPQVDEWTVELEKQFFGERAADGSRHKDDRISDNEDGRFQLDLNQQHAAILAAADLVDAELDNDPQLRGFREGEGSNSRDSSSSSSQSSTTGVSHNDNSDLDSDRDDGGCNTKNPRASDSKKYNSTIRHSANRKKLNSATEVLKNVSGNTKVEIGVANAAIATSTEGNRAISNTCKKDKRNNEDGENDSINQHEPEQGDDDNDDDDFLVPAFDEDINVFAKSKVDPKSKEDPNTLPGRSRDKSKGWATQQQRPGQFKRRKTRK